MTAIACGRRVRGLARPMTVEAYLARQFEAKPEWVMIDLLLKAPDEFELTEIGRAAYEMGVVGYKDERGRWCWRLSGRRPRLPWAIRKRLRFVLGTPL